MRKPRSQPAAATSRAVLFAVIVCGVSSAQTRTLSASNAHKNKPQQQAITFAVIPAQTAVSTVTLTAAASSGLPVNLYSTTPACSISGSTATLLVAGTCVIRANQAGNDLYSAAPLVIQSFGIDSAGSAPALFNIAQAEPSSGLPVLRSQIRRPRCALVQPSCPSLPIPGLLVERTRSPSRGPVSPLRRTPPNRVRYRGLRRTRTRIPRPC